MNREFYLIVVAAGKGERMGAALPKQYLKIDNKPLLRHTLEAFASQNELRHICLVINPEDESLCQDALDGYTLNGLDASRSVSICSGGAIRQQSVYNGLKLLGSSLGLREEDVVLIHDAARPFVTPQDIEALISALQVHTGASLAYNITDTCRTVNKYNIAQEAVSRDNLWSLQTPQAFCYGAIKKAHETCDPEKKYTDDTALVSDAGYDIALVPASRYNFKITTKEDLHMAEKLLSTGSPTRVCTGMGYDVHAFDDNARRVKTIRMCGIDMEFDRKLIGHSDADVGLHALCDAIYGAIGEGDIGLHFPPGNPEYKNADSAVFLEHALSLLRSKGGILNNVDITLICEKPKVGTYRPQITARLAQLTGIPEARINIKATTTEQLGFEGRKEGIAAQAVICVTLPSEE